MRNLAILAVLTALLSGCVQNNIEVTTAPVRDASAFNKAKALVADRMRDPEATRFKPQYAAYKTSAGDLVVCGTLNGKNAMGGYVGYKPFYARIRGNTLVALLFPDGTDDYGMAANMVKQYCDEAASGNMKVSS